MKKTIYILTLLSLILISKVNALPDFESDSITYVKDFNGDNIQDSIFIIRGYEGWIYKVLQIRIHSSLTGNSYKIQHTDYRAFHQFCSLVLLPDEMLKPQNNQLLDSIVKHYGFKEKEVTPALDWLMKGYQNYASSSDSLFWGLFFLLEVFKLDKNELFPNQSFSFIPLVIEVEIAPRKKKPIVTQRIRSRAIEGEKPCPDLIISDRGSKGSKIIFCLHISII